MLVPGHRLCFDAVDSMVLGPGCLHAGTREGVWRERGSREDCNYAVGPGLCTITAICFWHRNMKAHTRLVLGQPSWRLASDQVEAFVTQLGGHLGPVTFDREERKIQPYAVAPWAEEETDASLPTILKVLRGDFFCLPFGGNATAFAGERHPVHGETANATWAFQNLTTIGGVTSLHLSLQTRPRKGQVDKRISLVDGHQAVYCQHVMSGMSGPMSFGHHAMLKFPDRQASGLVSTSRFVYGQVFPEPSERPEARGYSFLKPGATFTTLDNVPTITGESTDLSRFPARRGYEDIAMIVNEPDVPFAWTAVSFPLERYVWFALKDPKVLRETVFWFSNGGRHYPPWNGRHVNVLGLEEVTSYFHPGLAESVHPNPISEMGYPTCAHLNRERPLVVNYIMGLIRTPAGFNRVVEITASETNDAVVLRCEKNKTVSVALDATFLRRLPPSAENAPLPRSEEPRNGAQGMEP